MAIIEIQRSRGGEADHWGQTSINFFITPRRRMDHK